MTESVVAAIDMPEDGLRGDFVRDIRRLVLRSNDLEANLAPCSTYCHAYTINQHLINLIYL